MIKIKQGIIILIFVLLVFYSVLLCEDVFEIEYDLNPFVIPGTGHYILDLVPTCILTTSDNGNAVLLNMNLTDGMIHHPVSALLKVDFEGNIQWFTLLTNHPEYDDFQIMMQELEWAKHFTVSNDGGFLIPIQGFGEGYTSFLLKLDAEGNYMWHNQLTDNDRALMHYMNVVKQTTDGEIYTAGYWRDTSEYPEYFEVIKFTEDGDTLWSQIYENFFDCYDLEVINEELLATVRGYDSYYCLRLSNSGNILWQTPLGVYSIDGLITISEVNNIGNYYIGAVNSNHAVINEITSDGMLTENQFLLFVSGSNYRHPVSLVEYNNNLIFTGRTYDNNDINCINLSGEVLWQFEKRWYGRGVEVLQKTNDGNFIVVSTSNDNILVLTKFDENGDYTHYSENISFDSDLLVVTYPNPFNPIINFRINCNTTRLVTHIEIYDIKGKKIEEIEVKNNNAIWNSQNYSSGVYMCKFKSKDSNFLATRKIMLLK